MNSKELGGNAWYAISKGARSVRQYPFFDLEQHFCCATGVPIDERVLRIEGVSMLIDSPVLHSFRNMVHIKCVSTTGRGTP
jgi:hypothetical protein